ncbi:MAG TPA: iron-sulfur cluster assembly scaffold protein [Pyrinomonadaceae bacterium]|nr:iron-sulfur cluster assembly scaffold protein [Pyrinomonadaceae bacterium]
MPVSEFFFNPRNVGDARAPSFVGRSGSFRCGATLRISLHIDESQRIVEAKFKAAGCSALVASASVLTEQVQGKTTGEAATLIQQVDLLAERFDQVEADRADCAALAWEALINAIQEYSDARRDSWEGEQALICTCFAVSEKTIEREIQVKGLTTIAEVTRACNAGAGCRSCWPLIEDILDDHRAGKW